jgi:trehalose 6-phosphate phosphatase
VPTWLDDLIGAAAVGRLGVLTDMDGTISPLAPRPDLARVDARARSALAALVQRAPLVGVVSGRELDDLRRMLELPGLFYSGGHGLSWCFGDAHGWAGGVERFESLVAPAAADLAARLGGRSMRFEQKRFGLAVHYRDAPDPAAARAAVLAAVSASPPARPFAVREGARVVELTPPVQATKGTVLRDVVDRFALTALLYFGDDVTDADAFRALRELRDAGRISGVAAVAVHAETASEALAAADVRVPAVEGVAAVLEALAKALAGES